MLTKSITVSILCQLLVKMPWMPKFLANKFSILNSANMARSLEKNHPESSYKSKTGSTLFPLADLPDLVLLNVANQLSNDDARSLSLTCMRFQVITGYPLSYYIKSKCTYLKEIGSYDVLRQFSIVLL